MKKVAKKAKPSHRAGNNQEVFQSTSIAPMVAAPDGTVFLNVDLCHAGVPAGREVFIGVQLNEEERRASHRQLENALFETGVMIAKNFGGKQS